jgi:hypothetical protein
MTRCFEVEIEPSLPDQGFLINIPDGGVMGVAYFDTDASPYSVEAARTTAKLWAAAPLLLECAIATRDSFQEILNAVDGLDGDAEELKRLRNLIEGRMLATKGTITAATGEGT